MRLSVKITFVLPDANMSGGTKVVGIYARELMLMGHHVTIVSTPPPVPSRVGRIKSWLIGCSHPSKLAPSRRSHLNDQELNHNIVDRFRPITDDDVPDADAVIATWWETAEWVMNLSPRKGRKIYFVQGHEVYDYLPINRSTATYRFPMPKIVVSEWLKEIMASRYGDNSARLVPNSIDPTQFFAGNRIKQPVPTVGLLYSPAWVKGFDVAREALDEVKRKIPDLRVVSFGSVEIPSNLAKSLAINFHLAPPQNQIRMIYSLCDVWLTASRSEGFNLPAMEAMACGTPVVATRTGWPAQAVKNMWNGVLVDIDDALGLSRGLQSILSLRASDWMRLSDSATSTVAGCSWKKSAVEFERSLIKICRDVETKCL